MLRQFRGHHTYLGPAAQEARGPGTGRVGVQRGVPGSSEAQGAEPVFFEAGRGAMQLAGKDRARVLGDLERPYLFLDLCRA